MTNTTYETDVVAWANEQAALLRSGNLSALDIEHIAEEIEDVGKSEQRELANRMVILLAHLLKWDFQKDRRGASWQKTIIHQRKAIARRLKKTPSLQSDLSDPEWLEDVWGDAENQAMNETGVTNLPSQCPWSMAQVLSNDFLPE